MTTTPPCHDAPPLDIIDAMTIIIVAVEAFLSLPFEDMSPDMKRGAVLFYDQLLQRVKPLLPQTPALGPALDAIEQAETVADAIRRHTGLGRRM